MDNVPRYLCLCNEGEVRSPTAVAVLMELAKEKGLQIACSFGAASTINHLNLFLAKQHLLRFKKIIALTPYARARLKELEVEDSRVYYSPLEESYSRDDPELVRELREGLAHFFD